jgi:hypothetical protein
LKKKLVKKEMKKILAATVLFFLVSVSSASACGYFKILSEYGVPVYNSYGYMIINGSKYPSNQKTILYNLTVDNLDSVGVDLTFTPTGDLINYVYGTNGYVPAHSVKTISLSVYVDGPLREGQIFVEANCDNGYVQGTIPVRIDGRGNAVPITCANAVYSCGVYPNCTNLNTLIGCYEGYMRNYFCSNNVIKFNKECTSYCCGLAGGTCSNGVCNNGSSTTSTTTTTLPSTTTTTIQTGCTPSYALSMTGCYDGYYRNYFCSGTNLKYTSSCSPICCSSYCDANGLCHGSSETTTTTTTTSTTTTLPGSTTTTIPGSTTTTIPSTCTPSYASSLDGCYSGYLRAHFCSNGNLRYTQSCYNYCCNLIGGNCNNGVCSSGSTSTTTTVPGPTTTTTVPSICTTAIAIQMTGCNGGYLRTYFCSGTNLKYTSSCISFCCSGNCVNGVCVA